MRTTVLPAHTDEQALASAARAAEALSAGLLVGFGTETVYGIAVRADMPASLDRLRQLKDRPRRPFSLHVGDPRDIYRYVQDVPPDARRLADKALPGPITLILPTGGRLADERLQQAGLHDVLVDDGYLGIRCPDQLAAQAMLCAVEAPVVAPSANLAGQPSPRDAQDVLASLDGKIDFLIDAGATRYGKDSTIVRFDPSGQWRLLRQGVHDERMIRRLLGWTIVFVCTGNACRSPMASGLAKQMLANRYGLAIDELPQKGYEVLSAGLFAPEGMGATPEAVDAAAELGADIASHRSHRLTSELIHRADLIFCMTESHVRQVLRMAPWAAGKVQMLGAQDIPDPMGGPGEQYRRTAQQIRQALQQSLDRELP